MKSNEITINFTFRIKLATNVSIRTKDYGTVKRRQVTFRARGNSQCSIKGLERGRRRRVYRYQPSHVDSPLHGQGHHVHLLRAANPSPLPH